ITLGVAGAVLVAAAGIGTWAATNGDDADAKPQDTRNSSPAAP
ncbi:MAG: serine/threonine protein kinase, partial [Streptomyces sp.]